jgi:hypothetical protein
MAKLFVPGTTIPKGYALSVTSWENDGDEYETHSISGLSKEQVNEYLLVLGWFSHCADDLGGEDLTHSDFIERLFENYVYGKLSLEFISTFTNSEFPAIECSEAEYERWAESLYQSKPDDVYDRLYDFLGCSEYYDESYMRVVSNVTVHHFEEEFVIPNTPPPIAEFNGDWSQRNDYDGWTFDK